jgi:flagellar biosynthesis regulator FlaF
MDDASFELLIEALNDPDFRRRNAAIKTIVDTNEHRAIKPLIDALHIEDHGTQRLAINALGEIGDITAIESLSNVADAGKYPQLVQRSIEQILLRDITSEMDRPPIEDWRKQLEDYNNQHNTNKKRIGTLCSAKKDLEQQIRNLLISDLRIKVPALISVQDLIEEYQFSCRMYNALIQRYEDKSYQLKGRLFDLIPRFIKLLVKKRIQQNIVRRIDFCRAHGYAYTYFITNCSVIENAMARELIEDRTKMIVADISKIRSTLECTPMNGDTIVLVGALCGEIKPFNDELSSILETDHGLVENITHLQSKLDWYQYKDSRDREWYEENKQYLRYTTSKY